MEMPIITTERLVLREIKQSDAKDMYEYAKIKDVGPAAGWEPHKAISSTKAVIQMFHDKRRFGQLGVFSIILKDNNKMIGTVELHSYVKDFKAELGYTISPFYQGNGYAVEASKALLHWGFTVLGLKRVECSTFTNNNRSRRVIEKLGFTFEGTKKCGYCLYDGSLHDLYTYGMTEQEYKLIYGDDTNGMQS